MANISQAFKDIVIPSEGVYSNDKADTGGETVYGIARNIDKDWDWGLVDYYKTQPNFPNNLNNPKILASAESYYKKNYWDKMRLDEIKSQKVATEMFDIGINMGISYGVKFAQIAANCLNKQGTLWSDIVEDGISGPATISAINNAPEAELLITLNCQQGQRYIDICKANPKMEVFFLGWIRRCKIN